MKILSWNCCLPPWSLSRGQRIPSIVHIALKTKSDIICLQEVFFDHDAKKIMKLLAPHGFSHFYHFKDLLTASTLPIHHKTGKKFKTQGELFSLAIADAVYGKGFQIVKVFDRGEPVYLANTHLLSALAKDTEAQQAVREKQVEEICLAMNRLPKAEKIILGDFNFQPNTYPYKEFTKMHFIDDTSAANTQPQKNRQLDYVIMNNNSTRKAKIAIFDNHISDHAALLANL